MSKRRLVLNSVVILVLLVSSIGTPNASVKAATTITFTGKELLGRPTDTSIMVTIVPASTIDYYYEYGTISGSYPYSTTLTTATGGQPSKVVISGLTANTKYYYHMKYHLPGETDWVTRTEYSFWTQRATGSTFTFDVTSDSHVNIMLGSASEWTKTMTNIANDHPDFEIDLGDTFAMDGVTTVATAETNYKYQYQFFNLVSHSASIFLAVGNHEQQEGWHLDDTADPALAPPVLSANAQKKYFPNPVPNSFYSGDPITYTYLSGDQLKEDYYAWTWGDALFVVIDPYWYTMIKPFAGNTGGGEPEAGDGDRWHWTLGLDQFNWLKTTLENSTAKYKFIFAHHMTGGSDDYVRGGANPANLVEWGGYNEAGTTYEWTTKRSGWGSEPIHQILVDNHVTAFFHGHDHQYAYEKRDGVVYQSLPAAGFTGNGFGIYTSGSGYTIKALPSDGHLRVTVNPTQATVDYVASTGGTINYTYAMTPTSVVTHNLTTAVSPSAGGIISPTAGTHTYNQGDVVTVTATANSGYTFSNWSGACFGSSSCSVTMDADKIVTATFLAEVTRTLSPGWNLLALPLQPTTTLTAEAFLIDIANQSGNCSEIDSWVNGGWVAHSKGLPFNNFNLALGQAYFVRCATTSTWQAFGTPLSASVAVDLVPGWNLLSVPYPTGLLAHDVLLGIEADLGACSEVDRWDNGGWVAHPYAPSFLNNFAIAPNDGYFVRCTTGTTFTP
jgi:hypothetical protein